jgi:hypothetical protein
VAKSIDLSASPSNLVLRLDTTVDIPVTLDTWLLATVRGPIDPLTHVSHALWPVVEQEVPPYAIADPIWIDANGDGTITPLR